MGNTIQSVAVDRPISFALTVARPITIRVAVPLARAGSAETDWDLLQKDIGGLRLCGCRLPQSHEN